MGSVYKNCNFVSLTLAVLWMLQTQLLKPLISSELGKMILIAQVALWLGHLQGHKFKKNITVNKITIICDAAHWKGALKQEESNLG